MGGWRIGKGFGRDSISGKGGSVQTQWKGTKEGQQDCEYIYQQECQVEYRETDDLRGRLYGFRKTSYRTA
jgi:hypothetical protein